MDGSASGSRRPRAASKRREFSDFQDCAFDASQDHAYADATDVESCSPQRAESVGKRSSFRDERATKRRPAGFSASRPLTVLAICTVLFGPIGTALTFLLLPLDGETASLHKVSSSGANDRRTAVSGSTATHMRVLHLSLANSDAKARYVIDERSNWTSFLGGCIDRLKISGISKVTDASGGHQILTIGDLIHEDYVVVHPLGLPANLSTADAPETTTTLPPPLLAASAQPQDAAKSSAAAERVAGPQRIPGAATSSLLHIGAPVCPPRHPDFRIAMLLPLVGSVPIHLPFFATSAARSASLVDWLIFHEHLHLPWDQKQLPSNVKFVDLGGGGLAELVGLKLGERLGLPLRNATTLLRSLRLLFDRWPGVIAEYKPTFGSVFEDFLGGYSHWGYADLGMIVGNLPLFLEREELEGEDIVTYAFDDMNSLHLRAQWTVHRNRADVNSLWQRCAHMGSDLERELELKVQALKEQQTTRFLSAEGCYSYEALRSNMRMKIANKQVVGQEAPSTQQVLFVAGAVWSCDRSVTVDKALLSTLTELTGKDSCRTTLPPLQRPHGSRSRLKSTPEGCGKWIPATFRQCVLDAPQSLPSDLRTLAVYARDGSFYAQKLEDSGLELANGCRQSAFFHFEEWKKQWDRESGITRVPTFNIDTMLSAPSFRVSMAGIDFLPT